jgi:PKD repeat protein
MERIIKPRLVDDGSGNVIETGNTGLSMETENPDNFDVISMGVNLGGGMMDAETEDRILKWLRGDSVTGVPTPVIATYLTYHGEKPDAGKQPFSLTGGAHAVVIVGYDPAVDKFLVLNPMQFSGASSKVQTVPVPEGQDGYAKWERNIIKLEFPKPVQAASRMYYVRDDPAPIDILTISPDGSRTGTDGTTGVEYAEDPDVSSSVFFSATDFTGQSDIPGESSPAAPSKDVNVRAPREGPYRVQIVGKAAGQLQLDFIDEISSSSGVEQDTVLSIDEPIAAGEVQKFEMGYSGNNPATAEAVGSFSPEARAGNDTNGLTGVAVPFSGEASFDYDGTISEYSWDFGDGASALGATPTHAYSQPGTYTAELTVTDDAGRTATDTLQVTIELSQQKPVARITGPYFAIATSDARISSGESFDRNNDPLSYKWDFGDGTTATSGDFPGVDHAYAQPGDYEVTLVVNDGKEDSLPAKSNVTVLPDHVEDLSVPECVTPGSTVSVSLANHRQDERVYWDIGSDGPVKPPPTIAEAQQQIDITTLGGEYGRKFGFASPLTVESVQAVSELHHTVNMTWQVPQNYTPGEHPVGFDREDNSGPFKSITSPCPVPENSPPLAHAGGPRYTATTGRPITFDGSQSSDPDGDSLTYAWDVGDPPFATGVRPTHTFTTPGRYYLHLSVNDGTHTSPLERDSFAVVDVGDAPPAPACTIGEIGPPVNDVSSADDPAMSAYKFGSRGVIPAKFSAACDGDPIDTQAEADAHPMKLTLTKLGSTPDQDAVVENTETGSANTGDLFRFDDTDDHYIYNVGVKNLASGTYKLAISEANGGATHDEWFSIK